MNKKMIQKGAEDTQNIQIGRDLVINKGVSLEKATEIALEVYNNNFLKTIEVAEETAIQRVIGFMDNFLGKLHSANPELLNSLEDPDMLHTLFSAQKTFARSGDKNQEELLTNLLIARAQEDEQSLKKIIFNESIETISKLTNNQIRIVSALFFIRLVSFTSFQHIEQIDEYIETYFLPVLQGLDVSRSNLLQLQYSGAGILTPTISWSGTKNILGDLFIKSYPKMFSKGFSLDTLREETKIPENIISSITEKCFHDSNKLQFVFNNDKVTEELLIQLNQNKQNIDKIIAYNNKHLWPSSEINNYILEKYPQLKEFSDQWWKTELGLYQPSSVGMALSISYLRSKHKINFNTDTWIF